MLKKFINIPNMINFILKKLNVFIIYRLGDAVGDQLCMTAVIEEIAKKKNFKIIVISRYSELFENNPNICLNIAFYKYSDLIQRIIRRVLLKIRGKQVENFVFQSDTYDCLADYMRETKSKESLIEVHSKHFKYKLNLKNANPILYFSQEELKKFDEKFKNLPNNFAVIQPIGKTTYTPNKEWDFDKFQEVVNSIDIDWIQTGLNGDKVLLNVLDFTSKTKNIRELAYVISKAQFVLCLEGLLNHLSVCVSTKSFVIFSGFSFIEISNYNSSVNIFHSPQVECTPCWLLEKCPLPIKSCTESISANKVIDVIKNDCDFL